MGLRALKWGIMILIFSYVICNSFELFINIFIK